MIRSLTLGVVLLAVATASAAAERPNVVLFLADDLGWNDVGYHGGEIPTPAIDRIAAEGVRLERFYAAPICSPTRAALLTGRDPMRLGIAYDQIHPWYNAGLPPGSPTLASAFRDAGYQTGIVGKWHLGHTQEHQLPGAHGFEHFFGHLHTNTDFFEHRREGAHDLQENGKSVHEPGVYLTHIERREALRFIRERDPERPFLLYVPFTAPHSPMQAPPEAIARHAHLPEKRFRRVYAAMVDELDRAIGSVLDLLDEQGLADDTIVMFVSDNGGSEPFGGDNRPLRGFKGQTFEGGIRVPAVLRWPGTLPAGEARRQRVTAMDLLPTLAAAAGVPLPKGTALDGRDLWQSVRADSAPASRPPLFFASEIPLPGVIQLAVIDPPWKLVQVVRERPTEMQVKSFLFAIDDDPNERHDLAGEQPEVVARLTAAIAAWRSQHPMAGTRGTLVPHPGWVPPLDWAEAVVPSRVLQPGWKNELPFSKALLDATAERGVLVDAAERERLEAAERERRKAPAD